jgi:hypothetical protein
VAIRKGVKQRYPLNSLLFNICIDPIFSYIMRKANHVHAYTTKEYSRNLIQAYADVVILIANSVDELQKLINDTETFYKFVNIKLNPKKCGFSIYGCNSKKKITISGEKKDYVLNLYFVQYLEIPMGSMRIEKVRFAEAKVQKILKEIAD